MSVQYPLPDDAVLNNDGFYINTVGGTTVVRNENGEVAMVYRRQQKIIVKCGDRQHIFIMRANISMAWVSPEDVQCCLDKRGGCCGQRKPGVIKYANESDARRWTNGGGR